MSASKDATDRLDTAIERTGRDLIAEARSAVTDHPRLDELIAYQENRLSETATERVRRHLLACPECAEDVLSFDRFDQEAEDDAYYPEPAVTKQAWETFKQRVEYEDEQQGHRRRFPERGHSQPEVARPATSFPRWLLLAASITFMVSGLSFWIVGLARFSGTEVATTRLASDTPFLVDLLPDAERLRRDASPGEDVRSPAGMDALAFRLLIGDQTPRAGYVVEIVDAGGEVVWTRDGLPRQPTGDFVVLVPRAELPNGRYQLRLLAKEDGQPLLLATYSLRLDDPQ